MSYLISCFQLGYGATVFLLISACQKRGPKPPAVSLPAELKSYTLFWPGTYWEYQDSASRQLDSVWVVSTDTSVFRMTTEKRVVIMKHGAFDLRTRSSQGGPDQRYTVFRACALPNRNNSTEKGRCWFIRRGLHLPNSAADGGSTDVFPYRIAREHYPFANLGFAIMYPYWQSASQRIGGRSYADVLSVRLTA